MFFIVLYLAKAVCFFVRLFGGGSGYTLPGKLVLSIYPSVLKSPQVNFKRGVVLISGTNGKTTTASLAAHLLETAGLKVIHNKSGSNLLRGVVSAVLLDMDWRGRLRGDIGIFEVDEFALGGVLTGFREGQVKTVVLLNLSRDQLDRYGEVDIILARWQGVLEAFNGGLILNSLQPEFGPFAEREVAGVETTTAFFDDSLGYLETTSLFGKFNAFNVNAAVEVSRVFELAEDQVTAALHTFEPAYGRGEDISILGQTFKVLLAKNPASFNHNLDLINEGLLDDFKTVVVILNDNIPDGRDVSWIYDISAEKLKRACKGKKVVVAGTRALDMAVRLNYAGVLLMDVAGELSPSVLEALSGDPDERVLLLPNYSAMLEARKLLTGRRIL